MPEQIFLSQAQTPDRVQTHVESKGSIAAMQGLSSAIQIGTQVAEVVDKWQTSSAKDDLLESLEKIDREHAQGTTPVNTLRSKAKTAIDDAIRDAGSNEERVTAIMRTANNFYKATGISGGRSTLFDKTPSELQAEAIAKKQREQMADDVVEAQKRGIDPADYRKARAETLRGEMRRDQLLNANITIAEDAQVALAQSYTSVRNRIADAVLTAGATGLDPVALQGFTQDLALLHSQKELAITGMGLDKDNRNSLLAANKAQYDALNTLLTTADGVKILEKANKFSTQSVKAQAFKDAPAVAVMTARHGEAFTRLWERANLNDTALKNFYATEFGREFLALQAEGGQSKTLQNVISVFDKIEKGEPLSSSDKGFMRVNTAAALNNPRISDEDTAEAIDQTADLLDNEPDMMAAFGSPNARQALRRSPVVRESYKRVQTNIKSQGRSAMREAGFQQQDWADVTVTFRHTKKGVVVDVSNNFPASERTGPIEGATQTGGFGKPTKASSLFHMERLLQDAVNNGNIATDNKPIQEWVMDTYGATPNFVYSYIDGTRSMEPSSEVSARVTDLSVQERYDSIVEDMPKRQREAALKFTKNEAVRSRAESMLAERGNDSPNKAEVDAVVLDMLEEKVGRFTSRIEEDLQTVDEPVFGKTGEEYVLKQKEAGVSKEEVKADLISSAEKMGINPKLAIQRVDQLYN